MDWFLPGLGQLLIKLHNIHLNACYGRIKSSWKYACFETKFRSVICFRSKFHFSMLSERGTCASFASSTTRLLSKLASTSSKRLNCTKTRVEKEFPLKSIFQRDSYLGSVTFILTFGNLEGFCVVIESRMQARCISLGFCSFWGKTPGGEQSRSSLKQVN